jgi:hypothetical protein
VGKGADGQSVLPTSSKIGDLAVIVLLVGIALVVWLLISALVAFCLWENFFSTAFGATVAKPHHGKGTTLTSIKEVHNGSCSKEASRCHTRR